MLWAAMRQAGLFWPQNDRGITPELFPHRRMKSSSRHSQKFKPLAAFASAGAA